MSSVEYTQQWRLKNPEKYKEQQYRRNLRRKDPEVRNKLMLYRNGLGLQDYNRLFTEQNGLCRGCYRHQSQFKKAFAVDHDHKSGKVRGLLCDGCNLLLGIAKDNPQTLERLIKYLNGEK